MRNIHTVLLNDSIIVRVNYSTFCSPLEAPEGPLTPLLEWLMHSV